MKIRHVWHRNFISTYRFVISLLEWALLCAMLVFIFSLFYLHGWDDEEVIPSLTLYKLFCTLAFVGGIFIGFVVNRSIICWRFWKPKQKPDKEVEPEYPKKIRA